jgi:myosin heavy subunit
MQLTEASRQQLKEVNGGLEARTTEYVESTSKEAAIRNKSLEEELFHYSKEVVDVMDDYDETELKLVKMRRTRELKRSALALVHEKMRIYSDKALEYGSIVNETSSQINELDNEIQQNTNYEKEKQYIEKLKFNIEKIKSEALKNAENINRKISKLKQSPTTQMKKNNISRNVTSIKIESEKKTNNTNGLTEQDGVQSNNIPDQLVEVDDVDVDAIWNASATKMSEVSWS